MRDTKFPFFSVVNHETGLLVHVVVWHVRSIRPIREAAVDEEDVTRLEFLNGDVLDVSDSIEVVIQDMRDALVPVTDWLWLAGRSER
jgi:hypothetical protein